MVTFHWNGVRGHEEALETRLKIFFGPIIIIVLLLLLFKMSNVILYLTLSFFITMYPCFNATKI